MAARALWKGTLKVGDVGCAIGLYSAASTSERIALNIVNRETLHPVRRRYVDEETGEPVERDDQVKGYELESGRFIQITPEEIAAAIPDSDKTVKVRAFIRCADIDKTYFDKPYHLAPSEPHAAATYRAVAEAMSDLGVAALAQAVLFRRLRNLLVRVDDGRLIATTLRYDYEVRHASEVFEGLEVPAVKGEMLDLAKHIVKTKTKSFDPADVVDRYEDALAELVQAKAAGRKPPKRKPPPDDNVVDLMQALRDSAGGKAAPKKASAAKPEAAKSPKPAAPKRRKAG